MTDELHSDLHIWDDADWLHLYRLAFELFGTRALWSMRRLDDPTPRDALVAARQLRVEGDLSARRLAEQLEKRARAAL